MLHSYVITYSDIKRKIIVKENNMTVLAIYLTTLFNVSESVGIGRFVKRVIENRFGKIVRTPYL